MKIVHQSDRGVIHTAPSARIMVSTVNNMQIINILTELEYKTWEVVLVRKWRYKNS